MIASGLNTVGQILSSPIRAIRRVSILLSPNKPLSNNDDSIEASAQPHPQKKRRRSDEQTPDKKIRKVQKMQPSLKRPRLHDDDVENADPQRKKQKTHAIFTEKDGGKITELEQRKTERARWCREQLHKQFEDIVDEDRRSESEHIESDVFPKPTTMLMTPLPSKRENRSDSLRRSSRKSSARASRRITMQYDDVKARVAIRKLNEQIKIEQAIRDREAEISQKEHDDRKYREERHHWQSVYRPQTTERIRGKSPIDAVREFCPDLNVKQSNLTTSLRKAMSRFHPDRSKSLPTVEKQIEAEEIFKALVEIRDLV